jgi:hypothetical protein
MVKVEGRLVPWSTISGRVVDPQGKPMAKARLKLCGVGMTIDGRVYLRTSWGEGGGGALTDSPMAMTFRGRPIRTAHSNWPAWRAASGASPRRRRLRGLRNGLSWVRMMSKACDWI